MSKTWNLAVADYLRLRAACDILPDDHPDENEAVDAYCRAMDALLALPAPDLTAIALKAALCHERYRNDPPYWLLPRLAGDSAEMAAALTAEVSDGTAA